MLTEKLQENLFKLVYALEILNKQGYFDFLIKCAHIYNNYEYLVVAEINTSEKGIFDENINLAEIAEKIANKIEVDISDYEINQSNFEKLTIVKIDNNGFTLFPEEDSESDKLNLKSYYYECRHLTLFGKYNNIVMLLNNTLGELGYNDLIKKLGEAEWGKECINGNKSSEYLNLDLSTFYFLNEMSVDSFSPGIWADYEQIIEEGNICTDQYDEIKDIDNIENIKLSEYDLNSRSDGLFVIEHLFNISKIKILLEARLYYEDRIYQERISQLYGYNLINKELRGFHNGYYCPISKSEFLASLPYSIDVKETVDRLVKYVETLPSIGQKEIVIKHVMKIFEERKWINHDEIMEKLYNELLNREKKHEEGQQRIEAGIEQIIRKIYPKNPSFIKDLFPEHRERYLNILKDIFMIAIPIENEETPIYKDIFSSLGLLIGNILTYFFCGGNTQKDRDITISNLRDSSEISLLLTRLDESERKILQNYSKKYGKIYNDIRHDDVNVDVSYNQTVDFIRESHKVIEIAVKYKH